MEPLPLCISLLGSTQPGVEICLWLVSSIRPYLNWDDGWTDGPGWQIGESLPRTSAAFIPNLTFMGLWVQLVLTSWGS